MGFFSYIMLVIAFVVIYSVVSESLNNLLSDKSIKNPTYDEMIQFIQEDATNYNLYIFDSYVCHDFTNSVLANAKEEKIRAGYVCLSGGIGHAIVCFDTTDYGMYYLEPQLDIVFTQTDMDEMISNGIYDVDVTYDNGAGEYFYNPLTSYYIDRWNNDIL